MVGATIWLLSFQHLGLYGLFLGRMLGDLVGVLLLVVLCQENLTLCFDWSVLRPMTHFGMPLIWGALMMLLMDAAGRYILTQYHGLDDVGYLGAAVKISSVFQMLVAQPFGIAWGGLMFQMAKWPNAKLIYSQIFSYLLFLSSGVALVVALFTRQLFHMFATPAYASGMVLLPFLLLVRAIGIMEYPAAIGIYLAGRTYWFAGIYTLAFAVNCGLNLSLDKEHGAMGVVVSWIAGWIAITVLMRIIGQRVYRLDNHWRLWTVSVMPWLALSMVGRQRLEKILGLDYIVQLSIATTIVITLATFVFFEYRRLRSESAPNVELAQCEVCVTE
jgi:O-antigen/teichoic acid export membrane protein